MFLFHFHLPETNSEFAPKNGRLEYYFPIGMAYFQGLLPLVSGRVRPPFSWSFCEGHFVLNTTTVDGRNQLISWYGKHLVFASRKNPMMFSGVFYIPGAYSNRISTWTMILPTQTMHLLFFGKSFKITINLQSRLNSPNMGPIKNDPYTPPSPVLGGSSQLVSGQ